MIITPLTTVTSRKIELKHHFKHKQKHMQYRDRDKEQEQQERSNKLNI